MSAEIGMIVVAGVGVAALGAFIALGVGGLAGVRAGQRREYEALQAKLGLRGETKWSASELAIDWEGALGGVPVAVRSHAEDDSFDWWRLKAIAPARRALTRFVPRSAKSEGREDPRAVHPTGDAEFDARVLVVHPMGPDDAPRMVPEARAAVLAVLAADDVTGFTWDGVEVFAKVTKQHLAPADLEALLAALATLARVG